MDPRKVSYNFNLNKSFYLLLCKIIAIAQSYQLYLISVLKSFWNFEKYDVIYLDFLSASAMSHFTPGKMEALVSRPLSPPNFPGSGKKIVWWDLWVPDLERWALNTGAVHQPELCLGDWGPSPPKCCLYLGVSCTNYLCNHALEVSFLWWSLVLENTFSESNGICWCLQGLCTKHPGGFLRLQPWREMGLWQLQLKAQKVLQRRKIQGHLQRNGRFFCFPTSN